MRFHLINHILYVVFVFILLPGCKGRCDPESDHLKCEDNVLYYCHSNTADAAPGWAKIMDCSEYNALCTQADVPLPIVISDASPFFLEPQTHGCALQENICDGDTDLHCSSDHSAIAVCSYTDEPAAMVIEGNDGDYPECVETSDGLAAFAFLEGECENYSSICDENNGMYKCESGVWRQYIEDVCDPEEHRICTEETDTDGNPVASCKFKDPCDDETGEYKICASEISNDAVFHCNFSSTSNIWKWSIYLCPKGTICEPYDDSYVSCN